MYAVVTEYEDPPAPFEEALAGYEATSLVPGTWILNTDESAMKISDTLQPQMDEDIDMAVLEVGDQWAMVGIGCDTRKWLRERR